MGRKRTASYKRARRLKNQNRRALLIATPRDPDRVHRSFNVAFYQRNELVFSFKGDGQLRAVDASTGRLITEFNYGGNDV